MTNDELIGGLTALGITTGYVIYGNDISTAIWTNSTPKPTETQIKTAHQNAQTARASARADLLAKLGITADEAALLLG